MRERQTWRDGLDAQLDLSRWLRSSTAREWLQAKFDVEVLEPFREDPGLVELLFRLYGSEQWRLDAATPIFVSREMCKLIEHASETFVPEPIYPADFDTLFGFMYYEKPFVVPDRYDNDTTIAAVCWSPILADNDEIRGKEIAEILINRDDAMREWLEQRRQNGVVDGLAISIYAVAKKDAPWPDRLGPMPTLLPIHITPWWWGMEFPGNETDANGKPTGAAWWWKIIQTTQRMMQQHISVRRTQRPERPQRREAKRLGVREEDVVVVRLRREQEHRQDEPMSEAHYTHRFIVGGHWRNQWYPSEKLHRQIWIAPYEKGPEGAPLMLKRRVFNFSR